MKPIIAVNFKTYREGSGKRALKLAKELDEAKVKDYEVILIVQATDLYRIASEVKLKVYSEHLDPISYGSHTGKILAETLKDNQAEGVLMNHAEDRMRLDHLDESLKRAKEVGLTTMVCANDVEAVKAVAEFNPDYLAVEPPELIGGDVSVSKANPAEARA